MSETKEYRPNFNPDSGLMYLIQQTTKQPTDEILGFFYDFGKEILQQGIHAMKTNQRSIRKNIEAMYPGTNIPFRVLVEAQRYRQYNGNSAETLNVSANIYVCFPENSTYINTEAMMDLIIEKQLLGGSHLPDFEPPPSRTPKMYKDLIKEVLNKNGQNILDSGHSRKVGSFDEALGWASRKPKAGSN